MLTWGVTGCIYMFKTSIDLICYSLFLQVYYRVRIYRRIASHFLKYAGVLIAASTLS